MLLSICHDTARGPRRIAKQVSVLYHEVAVALQAQPLAAQCACSRRMTSWKQRGACPWGLVMGRSFCITASRMSPAF